MTTAPTQVDLYPDPACPFAWITSRWLCEVGRYRPLNLRIHPMSLYLLNAGRDVGERYQRLLDRSPAAARVLAATAQRHGDAAVASLYTAYGSAMFTTANQEVVYRPKRLVDRWATTMRESIDTALATTGLAADLARAAEVTDYDDVLRANQDRSVALVGDGVGTPVVQLDGGAAVFGPILTSIPRGADAVQLFDAVHRLSDVPTFFELKRTLAGELTFS